MSMNITTLHTFDTENSADSIEWHPIQNTFVLGTYQLEENSDCESSKNSRKGRIYLFEYRFEANELNLLQKVETAAILDQKWLGQWLLTATSEGTVQIYDYSGEMLNLRNEIKLDREDASNLALSIDVDVKSKSILASDSKGKLSLIDLNSQNVVVNWRAHEFEAWTCAFDRWNPNVVYSGGDDAFFSIWDVRTNISEIAPNKIRSSQRNAGVTSFLNHRENSLFVGSYDEKLCIYDLRNIKNSVDEIDLHGGIWRIKQSANILLVACMYHNFSIVDFSSKLTLVGEYNEHKSICYGCDWSTNTFEDYHFFAACSFYDHKMTLCRVKV